MSDSEDEQNIETYCFGLDKLLNGEPTQTENGTNQNPLHAVVVRSLSARGLLRIATLGNTQLQNEVIHTLKVRNKNRKIDEQISRRQVTASPFPTPASYAAFMELQYENAWAPVSVGEETASILLCDDTYISTNQKQTTKLEGGGLNVSHKGIVVTKAGIVEQIQPGGRTISLQIQQKILYAAGGKEHHIFVAYDGSIFTKTNDNPQIKQIPFHLRVCSAATGDQHTLFVTDTGQVWAFGHNLDGRVDSTISNTDIKKPIQVQGIYKRTPFVQVAAGSNHSLALAQNGQVCSWGNNENGQLGQETTPNINKEFIPSAEFGDKHVHLIAAGGDGSCAITQDGALFTWGFASFGRNGEGKQSSSLTQKTPIQVNGGLETKRVTAVATHNKATIAVTHDGDVYGWGLNSILGIEPPDRLTFTPFNLNKYKCEGGPPYTRSSVNK